jgi:lipoate-protein ligase B
MAHTPDNWLLIDLPLTDYVQAWTMQKQVHAAKVEKRLDSDVVIFLEHPPVFTVGRRGKREHVKVSDEFLHRAGVSIVEVERGGDITYHGPGQIVGYPIVNLDRARLKVDEYITRLEDVMLRAAASFGVVAERNSLNRGIWVGDRKLGSIGICIRRGIAFHGFALNVNLLLEPFGWIDPCGLQGVSMTSLEQERSRKIPMREVREALARTIESVFGVKLVTAHLSDIRRYFGTQASHACRMPIRSASNGGAGS